MTPLADNQRIVVWFSCGAASAVAAKLAIKEYDDVVIAYCDTGGEHPDNKRFLKDCQEWFGRPIEVLRNKKYKDHFDVCYKGRYLVGPAGAKCTVELKKKPRLNFQQPDDIHILGYTLDEKGRAERFENNNPELRTNWILIERGLTKQDCLGIIWADGLKIPVMYDMGYNHNNCIGCVKGKMGYWNKIRIDFPDVFQRMCDLEHHLERKVLGSIFLTELPPSAGNYAKEPPITCGLGCGMAMEQL